MLRIRSQNAPPANGKLPFKIKILLIAILPVLAVSFFTGLIIHQEANQLIETESKLIESRIRESKRQELANYIALALRAVDHVYKEEPGGTWQAQKTVKKILNNLTFSQNGYFFAYDRAGTALVHPPSPQLIGANLWYLKDEENNFVIQQLMKKAVDGGDYHTYLWNNPSTGEKGQKMGYAAYLPKWGWMLGTGLYLDDIDKEVLAFEADMRASIRKAETILFLISLFAVLVVAISIAALNYSEHKLADTRLKALTKRIIDVQEEERKRVSNDLHDGINQLLVSIRHRLEMTMDLVKNNQKPFALLEKSLSILDTSIADVRRLSKDLHPSALDNMGLAAAIRGLGRDFEESTKIKTTIQANTIGDRLEEKAKIALYRVVQEALTNVARHADADQVEIILRNDDAKKMVALSIRDNGKGLAHPDSPLSNEGLGLRNMYERIESHGGNLTIRNALSGGLELFANLPQS
ncbi:cache domain-containing protein [Cohaesibacter gelatinilyticus]|uniref:Two-component system, NarL family, sensor kinase n=1 Tax=Cohaesibacter gelatinilyticus TaxID=372072 RepID=A0A285PFS8_9HYPH|nr:cache domain-containing protein [Cohaesibacter gelatinilyticus]SNZ18986.1 two-component system, NarL family, sensor kinase [Cohaesibacter gelatinilyticus]HAT86404.1 histidine kinase [Hyphomicrobiales bacterium]